MPLVLTGVAPGHLTRLSVKAALGGQDLGPVLEVEAPVLVISLKRCLVVLMEVGLRLRNRWTIDSRWYSIPPSGVSCREICLRLREDAGRLFVPGLESAQFIGGASRGRTRLI